MTWANPLNSPVAAFFAWAALPCSDAGDSVELHHLPRQLRDASPRREGALLPCPSTHQQEQHYESGSRSASRISCHSIVPRTPCCLAVKGFRRRAGSGCNQQNGSGDLREGVRADLREIPV